MLQPDSLRTSVRAVYGIGSYRMMCIRPTSEEGPAQMAEQAWLVSPLLSGLGPHSGNSWCTVTYTRAHAHTRTHTRTRTRTHRHEQVCFRDFLARSTEPLLCASSFSSWKISQREMGAASLSMHLHSCPAVVRCPPRVACSFIPSCFGMCSTANIILHWVFGGSVGGLQGVLPSVCCLPPCVPASLV